MADAVEAAPRTDLESSLTPPRRRARRETALLRRRYDDLWIGATALVAAMLALPLAQSSWHGPEVAAVLAIAATAMLAGERWAIAVVVIAELLLLPTVWPRAFSTSIDTLPRLAAFGSLFAIVPGVLSFRRAAAALVLVTGRHRTRQVCRKFQIALIAIGLIATFLPVL